MKIWIRFILKVNHKLDKMCLNIERKIDRLSKNLVKPAMELCDEIYDWTDFKRRLINLRVLFNNLREVFDGGEWDNLLAWRDFKASVPAALIHRCEGVLAEAGYGKSRFIEDYQKNKKLLESFDVK